MDVNVTNAGPLSAFDITLTYQISGFLPIPLSTVGLSDITFDCSTSQPNTNCLGLQCGFTPEKHDLAGAPYYTVRVVGAWTTCDVSGSGTLFSIQFHVAGSGATSFDIVQAGALISGKKETLLVAGGTPHPVPNIQVQGGYFQNIPGTPPVAKFTYTPIPTPVSANIGFNATQSYDPGHQTDTDRGIKKVYWVFNDASAPISGSMSTSGTVSHVFREAPTVFAQGYYPVNLVVVNAANLPQREILVLYLTTGEVHDIGVSIHASETPNAYVGDVLQITAIVGNRGNLDTWGTLNVTYQYQGTKTIGHEGNISLSSSGVNKQFSYPLDTRGLTPEVITITAAVQEQPGHNVTDADATNDVATVSFNLLPAVVNNGLSPTLLAVGGVVALAALAGGVQLMRRRRQSAREKADMLPV